MSINPEVNTPGVMGTKPASLLKLSRSDGVIFHLAHFNQPLVKTGDLVVAGQVIAHVGNNGLSHHSQIHIGAYQGSKALQIRFSGV
jgi:murein DD-endopeptidase MepM/ murein hydrolase activator NlpD